MPELDLQAYVATVDGRAYMAISGVPNSLGYEMQYLSVFPSVVAWLFSLHTERSYNGYQLTGYVDMGLTFTIYTIYLLSFYNILAITEHWLYKF